MTRLVIDANVFLSATVAAPDTSLALLMSAVRSGAAEIVVCDHLLAEVERGLNGHYFRDRLTDEEREELPKALSRVGLQVPDPADPAPRLRDPKDDFLLALAESTEASAIVTGDRDLLDHPHLEPPAITPREAAIQLGLLAPPFLKRCRQRG